VTIRDFLACVNAGRRPQEPRLMLRISSDSTESYADLQYGDTAQSVDVGSVRIDEAYVVQSVVMSRRATVEVLRKVERASPEVKVQ
jgi:hypothetical protein